MNTQQVHELKSLAKERGGWCVSIYMPTEQTGLERQQNPIRLRKLLDEAESRLTEHGMRVPEARELLESARALIDRPKFWADHATDGMACFFSTGGTSKIFKVPRRVDEACIVQNHFSLKPLMGLLDEGEPFYVLALSQNRVRLFRGNAWDCDEVEVPSLPTDMKSALGFDQPQGQRQHHTVTGSLGRGRKGSAFHGQGGAVDAHKDELLEYFHAVDRAVARFLAGNSTPLLLAAVDYEVPIYRQANHYGHLAEVHVSGSPDQWSASEVHQRALGALRPVREKARKHELGRLLPLSRQDRASPKIETILVAAATGNVESLWLQPGYQVWGQFRPEAASVEVRDEPHPEDQDLVDLAVLETLSHGGMVCELTTAEAEELGTLWATFRGPVVLTIANTAKA